MVKWSDSKLSFHVNLCYYLSWKPWESSWTDRQVSDKWSPPVGLPLNLFYFYLCCFPLNTCYSKFRELSSNIYFFFPQGEFTGLAHVYNITICSGYSTTSQVKHQGLPGRGSEFSKYKVPQTPVNTKSEKGQGATSLDQLVIRLWIDPHVPIFLDVLTLVKMAEKKIMNFLLSLTIPYDSCPYCMCQVGKSAPYRNRRFFPPL